MIRKEQLATGEVYHIYIKSIADFHVFNNPEEYQRIIDLLRYYQIQNEAKFSDFIQLEPVLKNGFINFLNTISKDKEKIVQIISYCIMPTHIHLILKQLTERGISIYMGNILNSYTHYFNVKHHRKGPLWESKFKNVWVNSDEQLIHLTRYIHLNPVTAGIISKPEKWIFSSYREFLSITEDFSKLCQHDGILEIKPASYKKFVNDQIAYQKELAKIKNLLFD